jgi:hypothetical protein
LDVGIQVSAFVLHDESRVGEWHYFLKIPFLPIQGDPVNAQLAAKQLVGRNFFIKKAPKIGKKH